MTINSRVNRRILLLTYAFPPTAAPEAIACAKRFGNLPTTTVDVLTVHPFREWMGEDNSLEHYVASRFGRIIRTTVPLPMRFLPLGRLGPLSNRPDAFRLMNRRMLKAATALPLSSYSAVITSSQWHSMHLVGLALKRQTGLPWISHFSDPWMDNPYTQWGPSTRAANARLERSVLLKTDLLTVTNKYAEQAIRHRNPDLPVDRVVIMPHAWDPVLYPANTEQSSDDQLVVRYLGSFYGPRSPKPLLRALTDLYREKTALTDNVRVELIGHVDDRGMSMLNEAPQGMFSVRSSVPYLESLKLMSEANLLVVLDAPARRSIFLPSKLIDYIGADRPILAFTPKGPTADLVRAIGGWVADPNDRDACKAALVDSIEKARAPVTRSSTYALTRDAHRTDSLGELLETVLEEHGLV